MKIHNIKFNKFLIPLILFTISIGGLFLFQALTYTPELSHAETADTIDRRTMDDIDYMQDITPEICQNSVLNKQYTLTDKRDNNTYTVARIKNQTDNESNCWMTQNLRIIDKEISYLDSDMESGNFTIPASSISEINPTNVYKKAAYLYQSHGGYYNWYTVTAGAGNESIATSGSRASSSICPKRWQLPVRERNNDTFYKLLKGLSANAAITEPYNFIYSGIVNAGSLQNFYSDRRGDYWLSTLADSSMADNLSIGDYISFGDARYRHHGLPARCTAKTGDSNKNIKVDIKPAISLDIAKDVIVKKTETNPSTAELNIKVSSNQKYSLGIGTTNPNLTSLTSDVNIPTKNGLLNTTENGWGIKKAEDVNYTALTDTLQTFYTASGAEIKTIPFTIGISTAPDLPNGEYSTDITITATQN